MNYSDEEKEAVEYIKYNNEHTYCNKDDVDFLLNLIQKQEKIINYSIDRILPSPEEYLEIKKIMKENKWGYDHSKKEYFRKWVENVNNIK